MDSNLVAAHIKVIIKAQFTLTMTAIQASVMEQWGYEISYKNAFDGKHKTLRHLFGDFSQSYTELPRLFLALEQENPGCVLIWKTLVCQTMRYSNASSGHSSHLLKGSNIVVPY